MEFLEQNPDMQIEMMLSDRNLDLIDEGWIWRYASGIRKTRAKWRVKWRKLPACWSPARRIWRNTLCRSIRQILRRIRPSWHAQIREWRFGPHEDDLRVRLSPRLLLNDVEPAAAQRTRNCARLLSYQVSEDLQAGSMVRLLTDFEPLPLPVQLVAQQVQQMPTQSPDILGFRPPAPELLPQLHPLKGDAGHDPLL